MISAAPIGKGLVSYLTRKAREDYYFNGGEPPGQWIPGSASDFFRVSGVVRRKDLRALTLGFDINGRKLVRNAGKLDGERPRHLGMSYVFNAPKSWSVDWAFAPPKRQQELQAAFDRAVTRTVREFIEPEVVRCRLRDGTEVPAQIAAAQFNHVTSREGDMHYHAHVVFPGTGLCPDGNTRATISKRFYDQKLAAGAYFRLALEYECRNLSLAFFRPLDGKGEQKQHTEVRGIPRDICRLFSKRRSQIEEQLDAKGLASAAASAVATLQTRRRKEFVPPRPTLFEAWQQELLENGFGLGWRQKAEQQPPKIDHYSESVRAIRKATFECTQDQGHFQRKDIFRETFFAAQGRGGVDPYRLYTFLDQDLTRSNKFVNLGIRKNVQRFTIPEVLRIEKELLSYADQLHTQLALHAPSEKIVERVGVKERPVNPSQATTPVGRLYDAVFGDNRTYTLDGEQRACLRFATRSPGRIKVIYGAAGTTKTTVAGAIADAYRKAGWKMYGTALQGVTARDFAEKTGVESDTVRMTLTRLFPTTGHKARHHIAQLLRAARGLPTCKLDRIRLNSRAVLFVDEASMVGLRDFTLLARACARAKATMIVIGDRRQLPAIQQGGALGSIIDRVGGFELKNIKRQENARDRERVGQLYRGNAEDVLRSYAEQGRVYVARTHADAEKTLISRWVKNGGVDAPQDHVIFAATNVQVRSLNDRAQRERLEAGRLNRCSSVTVAEETVYAGDRVILTKKSRKLGLENGSRGTILSIRNNPLSAAVTVRLDNEKAPREIPLRTLLRTDYHGLTRGYATSVHKMQGQTAEYTYFHLTGTMADRELAYVALSRHRKSVEIFTDENHAGVALTNLARKATRSGPMLKAKPGLSEAYSPLVRAVTQSRAKTLATDHLQDRPLALKIGLEKGTP